MSNLQDAFIKELMKENKSVKKEDASLKNLYNQLDDNEEKDVEGIIDDILVITDPEITSEEYDEVIERAQEIVEDTPEGDIPLDEEYLGQYAQTCPICGATFVTEEILEPGATCPICLEQPDAFVMVGKLEAEDEIAEKSGVEVENSEDDEEEIPEPITDEEDNTEEETEEEEDNSLVASEEVKNSENKLQENKLTEESEKGTEILEEATLNFKKYGIERDPSNDFSDDGNRFRGYKVGNMPISYLKSDGRVYLSIRLDYLGGLNYEEYSELPSYEDADKYNGVAEDQVDLQDVVDICNRLSKEYDEAVNNLKDVSDDDYKALTDTYLEKAKKEFEEAQNKIKAIDVHKLLNLSEYNIKTLKDSLNSLHRCIEQWSWDNQQKVSQTRRRDMMTDRSKEYYSKASWYLERIDDILAKTNDQIEENFSSLREDKEADIKEIMAIVNEPLEESVTVEETIDIHESLDKAQDTEEIQNIIFDITDKELQQKVQDAFDNSIQDNDSFEAIKEFTIQALEDNAEYLDEAKELKTELDLPDYEHTSQWDAHQVADYIFNHFREITGVDMEEIYNKTRSEDEPIFNDEVIDKTSPAMEDFYNKIGISSKVKEDSLYELDDMLASHWNDNPVVESKKLQETGEWDDNDDEMTAWLESMRDAANEIANNIGGSVSSVTGFDKYQGPEAIISTPIHGDVELWYDGEDDTGRSFVCKIGHVGWISGDIIRISDLLMRDTIPEDEILDESKKLKTEELNDNDVLEDEYKATIDDINDLNNAGDALNKVYDTAIAGESNFFNHYKEDIGAICYKLDKLLTIANNNKRNIE